MSICLINRAYAALNVRQFINQIRNSNLMININPKNINPKNVNPKNINPKINHAVGFFKNSGCFTNAALNYKFKEEYPLKIFSRGFVTQKNDWLFENKLKKGEISKNIYVKCICGNFQLVYNEPFWNKLGYNLGYLLEKTHKNIINRTNNTFLKFVLSGIFTTIFTIAVVVCATAIVGTAVAVFMIYQFILFDNWQ